MMYAISEQQQQLLIEIELHRNQLLKIGLTNGLTNVHTIAISKKLDVLITQYQLLALKDLGFTPNQ